jgi:branched-chain amino acid transport system ATP-binding protein
VHLALGVADAAAVLNHGRVVLRCDAQKLRDQPELLEQVYFGMPEEAPAAG